MTSLAPVSSRTPPRAFRSRTLAPYLFLLPFGLLFTLFFIVPFAIPGIIAALLWAFFYQPAFSPIDKAVGALDLLPDFLVPGIVLWAIANVATWTYAISNSISTSYTPVFYA